MRIPVPAVRSEAGADSDDVLNPAFDQARARTANDALSNQRWTNPRADGQLPDIYLAMGQTAENVGGLRQVGRREQDDYAVRSQQLAAQAANSGFFAREITPVRLPDGTMMVSDDSPRPGTTIEALAQLKPAFRPGGTVTAGNSCPLNDGAAAVIIMSDIRARELGITPWRGSWPPASRGSPPRSWAWALSKPPAEPSPTPVSPSGTSTCSR